MLRTTAFLCALLLALPVLAQVDCNEGLGPIDNDAGSRMSASQFIHSLAAREAAYAKAFAGFGYTADVTVQTLRGDVVDGEFHQVTEVSFDSAGGRVTKALAPPTKTLSRLALSGKDIETFVTAPPFALTLDTLADRDAVYSGRQKVGDHNASVFDLLPRNEQAPLRGFAGRTWVWAGQSSVLKTCGRSSSLPIGPLRYEINRAQVAGDNWFPALMRADEPTRVGDTDVHVRVIVKYENYKAR